LLRRLFRSLQRHQFLIATICITGRQWKRVLLSSESDKILKIVLLIAKTDQARALHYLKAHPLDKSKLKSQLSVRRAPLLRPFETRLFGLLQRPQFKCNQLLHPLSFVARLIIKQQRQSLEGRAVDCDKGSSTGY